MAITVATVPSIKKLARSLMAFGVCAAAGTASVGASAQTAIALGMSGWTGFAPLSLADKAGIFKKNGLDVELKMIPQKDRHLALASGAIQCAATTVETHVSWNANGVPITQIFQMDKSYGADGLAVRNDVKTFADLKGKTIASPQLGNTQDVALRYWLKKKGLTTTTEGGGDVHIVPQDNATTLASFIAGNIDGAWVPEPWVTRLVAEGNGTELVDESSLWKNGKFVVANTVAATAFAKKYPAAITAVIAAELDAIAYIKSNPQAAKKLVNGSIKTLTGSVIDPTYLDKAWASVDFTIDPLPSTLLASANHAHSLGLLDSVDLAGLYDLAPLDLLLAERGEKKVDAP